MLDMRPVLAAAVLGLAGAATICGPLELENGEVEGWPCAYGPAPGRYRKQLDCQPLPLLGMASPNLRELLPSYQIQILLTAFTSPASPDLRCATRMKDHASVTAVNAPATRCGDTAMATFGRRGLQSAR